MKLKKQILSCLAAVLIAVTTIAGSVTTEAAAVTAAPTLTELNSYITGAAGYVSNNTAFADISETSKFNNVSKALMLCMRSGIDTSSMQTVYFEAVSKLLSADGTLNVALSDYAYPNDSLATYAYLLNVMALSGNTTGKLNGIDVLAKFNTVMNSVKSSDLCFGSDPVTYANTGMNPYHLSIMYLCAKAYKCTFASVIANAMDAVSDDNGLNYYGYSADNNATLIAPAYSVFGAKADSAVAYTESEFYDATTGITHSKYEYNGTVYDDPSPDSTGLALALFSSAKKTDLANNSYQGLLTFATATGSGAFTYYGADNYMATVDALTGLLTYSASRSNEVNPYDVSDKFIVVPAPTTAAATEAVTTEAATTTAQTTTISETTASTVNSTDATISAPATTAPSTGDINNITIILIVLAVSGVTLIFGLIFEKKKRK